MALASSCISVSNSARPPERERARALARRVGLPFVEPPPEDARVVVVERAGVHLRTELGETRSHPGIGLVRVRRLVRAEERDPLVDLADVRPGDSVFDGTFGFGQDALVFAHAVGPEGRIVAVESSPLLAALAIEGMPHWPRPANELVKRIHLETGDSRSFLAQAADRSFDVVYFDPMFRDPKSAAPDFVVLRALANSAPLDAELLAHARRVARRSVVVKDAWPGRELERLGIPPHHIRRRAEIVYGIVRVA